MSTTFQVGSAVWVRDPDLKDEQVFFKGTVVSQDAKNVRRARPDCIPYELPEVRA